ALQAVARHGSISAAARALHFTAPAVSQQLAALERDTGTSLFERTGRSIRLTDAGVLLAAHADIVLTQLDAASAALSATHTPSGPLRIAAFPTAIVAVLAPALQLVHDQHPAVQVTITEAEPETAERLMRTGLLDVAVVHSYDLVPRVVANTVESLVLFEEPMYVVQAIGSGPSTGTLALGSLSTQRWIVPTLGSTCHELVQRACGAAGFVPTIAAQCTDYASTLALVRAGIGVALVPSLALEHAPLDGLRVSVTAVPLHRHVSLQHPVGRATPAVESLIQALYAGAVHRASRTPLVG
ncbi:MAG: LysR family transcriptional regulator, partial [Ilumatobacteraceae bacterium]|nr:LysR family transcriptional regulator [Ilumatobacteraceae bacterium]